jgi:A/G-specific adenine glycosylase
MVVLSTTSMPKNQIKYPSDTSIKWFRQQLSTWGVANLRDFPWRRTTDPYHLIIAESLLQKTEAQTVAPIYELFLELYPSLQDLAAANLADITKILKPLGLFFRAERLQQCAEIILNQYDGKVPNTQEKLLKLPGIGDYSARAIGSQAFNQPLAVLDANVARSLERFFGLQGGRVKSRCKILWGGAELIAPKQKVGKWNLTLLDFGAMVCTAPNPSCQICPLSSKCHHWSVNKSHIPLVEGAVKELK